jgi:hypothetical protein
MAKRNIFLILLLLIISYFIYILGGYYYYAGEKEIKDIFVWSNMILIFFIAINLVGFIYCINKIKKIWILIILYLFFIGNFLLFQFLILDNLMIFAGLLMIICIILFSNILSFLLVKALFFIENRI